VKAPTKRKRNDPRAEATRTALVEAAEKLFAEKGIDNVSLKEIRNAIGSENNGVIAYYFGTKADLIEAIYAHRLPDIERERSALLDRADRCGIGNDMVTLLFIGWVPILKLRDTAGQATHAAFLASLQRSTWGWTSWKGFWEKFPATSELLHRFHILKPELSDAEFVDRLHLIAIVMTKAIDDIARLGPEEAACGEDIFANALTMAAVIFNAPKSGASLQLLEERLDSSCFPAPQPDS
jgi:AcrR family transcriptional regulator